VTDKPTVIKLSLTDGQGIPIEQAAISSQANMTNMDMPTKEITTQPLGHGEYLVRLHLFMAGPWAIMIQALAEGFAPSQQNLYVQVT
jgi:nitrogen fixation protein FixH